MISCLDYPGRPLKLLRFNCCYKDDATGFTTVQHGDQLRYGLNQNMLWKVEAWYTTINRCVRALTKINISGHAKCISQVMHVIDRASGVQRHAT